MFLDVDQARMKALIQQRIWVRYVVWITMMVSCLQDPWI